MFKTVMAAVSMLAIVGCAQISTGVPIQPGSQFELKVGQGAQVIGSDIVVRFRGVAQDSRCPSDVQCVSAGNAVVNLSLSRGDGTATEAILNTTTDPKTFVFAGYTVRLVGLKPVPISTKPTAASDYVAILEVVAS